MRFPAVLSLLVLFSGMAVAQPRIDKTLGEEEQIQLREEWFSEMRMQGIGSAEEAAALRLGAAVQMRQAIASQEARRALGVETGQNVWVEMGPSPSEFGNWAFGTVSGRIQAIEADWNTGALYVGAGSGGVWKSMDDGLTWTNLTADAPTQAVGAIAVDPYDSNEIWVGTGDNISSCEGYFGVGMLRSTDGGESWELRNGTGGDTIGHLAGFGGISIDPRDTDKLVVGGRKRDCTTGNSDAGIYTTDDGGESWTERLGNVEIHEIVRNPQKLDTLWVGTDRGVFKSIDNGVSWVHQTNGLPWGTGTGRTEIAISPSDPDFLYVIFAGSQQFWRTRNDGGSWQMMTADACDGQCSYNLVIRVHPTDPETVYRGTIKIFKTEDGGVIWNQLTNGWGGSQQVHQDTHSLLTSPLDPEVFYVGSDGGFWKSEDGGQTFENKNGNLNVTQFYAIGIDENFPGRICGGAQDNSSLARDGNNLWLRQAVTGDGFVCAISPVNPNVAYITSYPSGGFPNVWRATNGLFGNFNDITGDGSGIIQGDRINWVTPYILDPVNPETLYLGTHRLYRSDDTGDSWTQVGPPDLTNNSSSLRVVEVNRNFPEVVYTGSQSGRFFRSENGGLELTDHTVGLPNRAINDIAGDPSDPNRAFIAIGGFNTGHVWEWKKGIGYTDRSDDLPNVPANTVLMLTGTDILVGTDVGVYRSYDGGLNWVPFMDGMPQGMVITDLKLSTSQNQVTAGSYARGAWRMSVDALQPIVIADSVVLPLTEVDGDGDGDLEPGESWSLTPVVRNAGGETALGVTASLSTSTPGITILNPVGSYGNLFAGQALPAQTAHQFTIDPSFTCGTEISFDLTGVATTNDPVQHADQNDFFSATVQGGNLAPAEIPLIDEDFETPPAGWTHEAVSLGDLFCPTTDDWKLAEKDAAHGQSYHLGNGPGGSYAARNFAWLHPGGKDSADGPGIFIPVDAIGATLSVTHWYDTAAGQDGGRVLIDGLENDDDVYTGLKPVNGYPGTIGDVSCNGLEGEDVFDGSSGGWVTDLFDLAQYRGRTVYLAFVFGSDNDAASGEGWYIDDIQVDYLLPGDPTCDVVRWPGEVVTAQFDRAGATEIQASWGAACNIADFPEQSYSIQVGDLDALAAGGGYTHAPLAGSCDESSGTTFAFGAGNEYYLIVPSGDGYEGGAGSDSQGLPRPQSVATCGEQRSSCD